MYPPTTLLSSTARTAQVSVNAVASSSKTKVESLSSKRKADGAEPTPSTKKVKLGSRENPYDVQSTDPKFCDSDFIPVDSDESSDFEMSDI